ncbi:MAG: PD-(D/E)XK nuclease family protein [Chloroflexi bacterium]|nr:PD-(D/E)XK nuclease family protein [Chloroflexota bacterium]
MANAVMRIPELKLLAYITPSRVFALEECFLRVAFELDHQFDAYRAYPPRARLGSISHTILEKVSKGALRNKDETKWRELALQLWHEEVEKHERQVLGSESEQQYGIAERWPRYNLQKALTVYKALEITASLQKSSERVDKGSWVTEQYAQAYDGKLRGRIDAIYLSASGVEIIDYKTGRLYDEDEEGEIQLKENYRRQLLLYAAIYHAEKGQWPIYGHIIPLTGQQVTLEIDINQANHEVVKAFGLLTKFNNQVAQNSSPAMLAQPAEKVCRYCAYRSACPVAV